MSESKAVKERALELLRSGLDFVDTHCHIDGEEYEDDRAAMLERARAAGISALITMGTDLETSRRAASLAAHETMVYAAAGYHPEGIDHVPADDELQAIAALTKEEKVIAIGEIGLDYYWEKDEAVRRIQREAFIRQLRLARELDLPVCIHDREAHGNTFELWKREGKGVRGVLHCYSGSVELAREFVKLGCYIGIDGPLTYKNAAKLPEVAAGIDGSRLLLETDSPYLTPVPYRGKRNEPTYVPLIAAKCAEIRGESLEVFAARARANTRELYGI
ncbi:hypothetical protein TAMA11512_23050 [Selenomonas sp. TAMA-11512]|uniref:TatD family hydrolase n=1 Tax=Selenomonas sp. TAMA-11512 TaxID=3095337 RepID=UPI003088ABF4|nr:hypothetical protein TAMA11512_23050 [Selenomonas sp. TAMA-11512]